jgi:hypothetical protein
MKAPSFALILLAAAALAGCTSQQIALRDNADGKVAYCGGTPLALGELKAPQDQQCINTYEHKGYDKLAYLPTRYNGVTPVDQGNFFPFH